MKNFFRRLFGIRVKRRALPVTPPPPVGASITRGGYKIKVTQACGPELWDWLLLSGWRVIPVRHDRRASTPLPDEALLMLSRAGIDEREQILGNLLSSASRARRPQVARARN